VERAQELLREGRTALADIATRVGFETQSHFTSVFRRVVGLTPKRYREMQTLHQVELDARQQKTETAA